MAVWLAAAVLQVVLHGISLDETATAAPIIAGAIQYPAGHPHEDFYRTTYSLLQYIAGGLWLLWPDAFGISAIYNVAFLFVSGFAPFMLTLVLTERPHWAWVAGALALSEAAVPFDGLYPLYVYPFPYSNGHIGMHLIVLVAAMLLSGRWRAAGFLLGIFPAVHGTLAAVAWVWAALWLVTAAERPTGPDRRRLLLSGIIGLAICAALAAVILSREVAPPAAPYLSSDDALAVYRQFTLKSDLHRQTPRLASFGYLVNPLAFFLLGAVTIAVRRSLSGADAAVRRLRAILDLGAIGWAVILAAYLYRQLIGTLPLPLEIAMPFRLANLTAMLLIPLTVATLAIVASALHESRRWVVPVVVAGAMIIGALYSVRNPPLVSSFLLMALWGVVVAAVLATPIGRARSIAVALLLLLLAAFYLSRGGERPFIALLLPLFGTAALFALSSRSRQLRSWSGVLGANRLRVALLGASVVAVLAGIAIRGADDPYGPMDQTWRRMKPEDRALRAWVAAHTAPDESILTPMWPYAKAQAKLERPQLIEWETMYAMTYAPRRAAILNELSRDVFGVDYADARALSALCGGGFIDIWCQEWADSWKTRTRAGWQALGRKYAVRLVMAPREWRIDLPSDTTVGRWTMYRIP